VARRPQQAAAEGVYEGCRGLTQELIVGRIEAALERAYAEGAASTARPSRKVALLEMRSALQGLANSVHQHTRTCEIELADLEKKPT